MTYSLYNAFQLRNHSPHHLHICSHPIPLKSSAALSDLDRYIQSFTILAPLQRLFAEWKPLWSLYASYFWIANIQESSTIHCPICSIIEGIYKPSIDKLNRKIHRYSPFHFEVSSEVTTNITFEVLFNAKIDEQVHFIFFLL